MFFNYLTLISALFISSVAIYYSVAGLAQIFAAAVIPVIIMGTALEVGKLVVAVWLHKNWREAVWWLKWYLSVAVLVLMFITSMGIFGYLSKSHVEQAAADSESRAQTSRIESDIARHEAVINRAEQKIKGFETSGSTVDASLQQQIDKEQERINTAYDRIQPQIDQQLAIIKDSEARLENELKPYEEERLAIKDRLATLDKALQENDVKLAQGIVGTKPDGRYGPATAKKIEDFRIKENERSQQLLADIQAIRSKPQTSKTNAEQAIAKLRSTVQAEIDKSNELIIRLRERVGQDTENNVETLIAEQQAKIKESNTELDTLIEQKYKLEAEVRKLEAEVGPIKYIAEFIYAGEADKNLLEEAVRWVIVVIIFVFDPLAVLLLIASQYSFERAREEGKDVHMFADVLADPEPKPNHIPPQPIPPENVTIHEYEITPMDTHSVTLTDIIDEVKEELDEEISDEHRTIDEDMGETHGGESGESTEGSEEVDNVEEAEVDDSVNIAEQYLKSEVTKAIRTKRDGAGQTVVLNRVGHEYISYNGKTFQQEALLKSHPELNLDLNLPVDHGKIYPVDPEEGKLFFNTSLQPTKLMRFNGVSWDTIDKNILELSGYSNDYINYLINAIADGDYNPELLNDAEKTKIEMLLTQEV